MNTAVYGQMVARRNLLWQTILRIAIVETPILLGLMGLIRAQTV